MHEQEKCLDGLDGQFQHCVGQNAAGGQFLFRFVLTSSQRVGLGTCLWRLSSDGVIIVWVLEILRYKLLECSNLLQSGLTDLGWGQGRAHAAVTDVATVGGLSWTGSRLTAVAAVRACWTQRPRTWFLGQGFIVSLVRRLTRSPKTEGLSSFDGRVQILLRHQTMLNFSLRLESCT